jgi:type IV pilus assembly protein PilY1
MKSFVETCKRWSRPQSRGVIVLASLLVTLGSASAQWPNLPVSPLTIQALGDPNVVLTFDDSGSMSWGAVPDGRVNDGTVRRLAARWNPLAYNPFTRYEAPYDPVLMNGTRLSSSFTAAPIYGFRPASGTENLSNNYQTHLSYQAVNTGGNYGNGWAAFDGDRVRFPIERAYFYAFYNDIGPGGVLPAPGQNPATFTRDTTVPVNCGGVTSYDDADCYVKVTVPTDVVHEQNFANWFSFYRTRNLLTASAANLAFYDLPRNFRVTWQGLTTCSSGFNSNNCIGFDGVNESNNFRPLSNDTHRNSFFRWLSRVPHNGFTPLVQAMERAGQFYTETGVNSSIANQPGIAVDGPGTAPTNTCRPSYHVMMTDGLWNGGASAVGNVDGAGLTFPDGSTYTPQAPYSDATAGTLADVAFRYWANDLQPTIANNVSRYYPEADRSFYNPRNDPANWQHMVNFTIGLGLGSILTGSGRQPLYVASPNPNRPSQSTYLGSYPALAAGTLAWPAATSGSANTVSDLWHAALNSRGFFFSADNSQTMRKAFDEISTRINAGQTSSGQQGNTSSRTGGAGNLSIRLSYDSASWTSTIDAYNVRADGSLSSIAWSTDTTFTSNAGRKIWTWDAVNSTGVGFAWTNLTAPQKTAWFGNDEDLFNWVVGDRTNENAVAPAVVPKFRKRLKLLGDIIGSDVVVSAKTDYGYGSIPGAIGASYKAFVTSKQTVVYAGANDGMLHAFKSDGSEAFAYVPSSVSSRLKKLAEDPYVHENFLEGPLSLWDYYQAGAWRSVLVGGLGSGGKTVFGLDVTNVQKGLSFASTDVLFEINDPELGYSFSRPVVARQPNGQWVAIFGNGYGGASSKAMLFVYNLSTKVLTKIDTGEGTAAAPNGLSSPVGLSLQTGTINAVYAGDYQGNLWRFNVSSAGAWTVANAGAPFFVAKDSGGKRQPITAAPTLIKHPAGGTMVIVGTGKFFETQDRAELHVHTMYGLRDLGNTKIASRSALVAQTIDVGNNSTALSRALSNNAVDYTNKSGWYIDLNSNDGGVATGEKVVSNAIQLSDGNGEYIFFNTFIPSRSTCEGIGVGYFMYANAFTGGLATSKFDVNDDGVVDSADLVGGKPAAAFRMDQGSLNSPTAQLVSFGTSNFASTVAATTGSCGGLGQPVCNPGNRCVPPLVPRAGICERAKCEPGDVTINNLYCFKVSKTATWMELK